MTKVLVIGAGGIIGQHLMISVPTGVEAVFTRRQGDEQLYQSLDICKDVNDLLPSLDVISPDVIVNLAGESSVDEVEKMPSAFYEVNVLAVGVLRQWCDVHDKHLIHVSSQAVIGPRVNEYGKQKYYAEELVRIGKNWTIVRPTLVLGIRPFPGIGRENPAERILSGKETESVCDRFFSVSFAWDVAEYIWQTVISGLKREVVQVGHPRSMTRVEVAHKLGVYPKKITHDSLGIAPRQIDTTYQESVCITNFDAGFSRLEAEYGQRSLDTLPYRAKEISAFLHRPWQECLTKLQSGFGPLHNEVTEDFHRVNPVSEEELLGWYRGTEQYIWELTAYHCDPGFNYAGMCKGIVEALKSKGVRDVSCLGDGVGTLTIEMMKAGLKPLYHDLEGSCTSEFALSRFNMRFGSYQPLIGLTIGFTSLVSDSWLDAVVSLDFLEHVPNVEEWVRGIYKALKPGGWFVAQNAFNIGSGPQGSIPMHLAVNDHYETDWDPLLSSIGFVQESSNWYRKPE